VELCGALKNVVACGGSWMAPQDAIASGDFERIRAETARAVRSVREPAAVGG
jgi:2-dehydro-3-deoxyphosphogluconate aldolase/(4S)-4-hydroxy-2-oxoglutarate aldolase